MKKVWKAFAWVLLVILSAVLIVWYGFLKPAPPPIPEQDREQITLMPLPAELKLRKGNLVFTGSIEEKFTHVSTPRLERAVLRFEDALADKTGPVRESGSSTPLLLQCQEASGEYPEAGCDESYTLHISGHQIVLKAPSETGILHGLETLQQLITWTAGNWVFPRLTLQDRPRYPWRGLMIDACRHWIPKEVILRNLDGMAALKMNVLHWHLTDYQAFRVESNHFPRLHEMGSGGDYYSREDIREVVNYAADRGIRVVPEFDLPGHSTSWFAGYPWLASAPGPYIPDTVFGVLEPIMDPTREEVYQFLEEFFNEMSELFPDRYVHIGGDEVATRQWETHPDIQRFMKEHQIEDVHGLQAYFNLRLHKILGATGKQLMGWDEIIHPDLPLEGTVVQSWRNQASLWEAARRGYGAVLSAGYYLDHKQSAGYHYRVDPAVIPGAVAIDVDSSHWKSWDCILQMKDLILDGSIFLFGQGDQLRGVMHFMETAIGFEEATLQGNRLSFSLDSDFGTIQVVSTLEGDSITGSASISLFKLEMSGIRSGGSDMPGGEPLPEFKRIEPLTEIESARILGGEACIWSEMVDRLTLESRVWPRAAAVAEKLWSPAVLTGNEQDMYRRLMWMNVALEERGMQHRAYRDQLLRRWVDEPLLDPLRQMVELLQEDRFFNRMVLYDPEPYTTTPLNRVVDAAPPESYRAYLFGQEVDRWLESGDEASRIKLVESLESWMALCEKLTPVMTSSVFLLEMEPHVRHLSEISRLGLSALEGTLSVREDAVSDTLFMEAGQSYGGTLLAVTDAVQKLVTAASVK